MMKATTLASALLAILGLSACGPETRDGAGSGNGPDAGGTGSGSGSGSGSGTARQCNKMDIVFVIDDSGSMGEEQANLQANFPMFANLLSTYTTSNGDLLDFRVAVTTTGRDVDYTINLGAPFGSLEQHEQGDNGAFRGTCNSTQRWLESSDPNMAAGLACRANVGTSGPSVEMPLLMTKYALSERLADTNAGFLRDDALLAIVMITDENDASTTQNNFEVDINNNMPMDWHAADQVMFLDALKGNRTRWAAAAIAGDGDCTSNFGDAVDATRLKEFVNLANSQGSTQAVFSSICQGDLTSGLQQALETFQAACGEVIF